MDHRQRKQIHEAMVRLAHGDRRSFDAIYEGLCPALLVFTRRLVARPADAEDLVQRTLLKVFARISDFDTARDGVAWAFGIAMFEVRTLRRQTERRRESPLDSLDPSDTQRTPEQQTIDEQLLRALGDVLVDLPADDRAALLSAGGDPSVSGAAWRKRRQRALTRLRRLWGARR